MPGRGFGRIEAGGEPRWRAEDQTHTEHGDEHTDREEDFLPELAHPAQHGGVDDRVVEGRADLENAEDRVRQASGPPYRNDDQRDDRDGEGRPNIRRTTRVRGAFHAGNRKCAVNARGMERLSATLRREATGERSRAQTRH